VGKSLLVLNGATLTGCAIFFSGEQTFLLLVLLFGLPMLDREWKCNGFGSFNKAPLIWLALSALFVVMILFTNIKIMFVLSVLLFTALPEEWFFRSYFLQRLALFKTNAVSANIICSCFFALLHLPAQGGVGLLTFFPSLLFGYVYQNTQNLLLVVGLHALANMFFMLYAREWLFLLLKCELFVVF